LLKDFLNVIESFSFTQFVSESTHQRGHTPDLVLSYGLSASVNNISALPISDHSLILFDMFIPNSFSMGKMVQKTRLFSLY